MRAMGVLAALAAGVASADAAPVECAPIQNDLDRLACYDREVGRTPTATHIPVTKGKWVVHSQKSALTDKIDAYASLESDEVVNCGWNNGAKIELVVRCLDNRTAVYFHTGCHMTSSEYDSYGDVTYRVDDEKARTVGMFASTDNRSLGLWRGGPAIQIIKQMFGKSRLVTKMTPYSESPFTATFSIAGLEEAAKPVREACNW